MKDASLIKILTTLSIKECNKFVLFVQSPYFNKDEYIVRLLKYLKKLHPKYKEEAVEKVLIFKKIFKQEPFDYLKLRRLFSATLKLLEQFFLTEFQQANQIDYHINLMSTLKARNLDKRFQKIHLKTKALIDENKTIDGSYYFNQYKYFLHLDEWLVEDNEEFGKPELLQEAINHLDRFYLLEKLNRSIVMLNRSTVLQTRSKDYQFTYPLIEEVATYVEQNQALFKDDPGVLIYYKQFVSLLDEDDEASYFELCQLVDENIERFSKREGRFLYFSLLNYATEKINQGNFNFFKHSFEIQKKMLIQGFLMQNEVLPDLSFRNLVTSALALKEFDWTLHFIEEYHKYLPKNIRTNAYNYNLANYYCEISEYDKAHKLLWNVEYKNLMYNLNAKAMLLRIFYETNAEEALDSHISAFKVYLMRNKMIAKDRYKRYYNLFRFTATLHKIKMNVTYTEKKESGFKMDKLKTKIQKTGRLPFKRWLNEQIELVEKKYL